MVATRKIVAISDELLQRIDEQRSELDREEFISMCIDMALGQEMVDDDETEEEVACVVPRGTSYGAVAALETLPTATRRPRTVRAVTTATEDEPVEEPLPLGWWVPALLLFGFGDTLTSALVFARGGVELNPIMRLALELPGGLWTFVLIKTIFLATLMLIGMKGNATLRWVIPLVTTAVGSYLVWNNLFTFLRLS